MRRLGRMAFLFGLLIVATPVLALPEPTPEELQHNRALLERRRADRVQYERLRQQLKAFKGLPAGRQDRLRQLDQDLHEEDLATQARLWRVMDRYSAWVDRLSDEERSRLAAATDARQRLQVVRAIREEQWIARLPAAKRKQIVEATPETRTALIAQLREEEQKRRLAWHKVGAPRERDDVPLRRGPVRRDDLPAEVKLYLTTKLEPELSKEDRKRLEDADGKGPLFAKVLRELVEKYPLTLPGPWSGPITQAPLPLPVKVKLRELMKSPKFKQEDRKRLLAAEGKWPDYAIVVTELIRKNDPPMPEELGPCKPGQFSKEVQAFLKDRLLPSLAPEEKAQLAKEEGQWPEYPQMIQKLALKYHLPIPGLPLPGPKEFWDRLRVQTTDVPLKVLRDFAFNELTEKQRGDLRLSFADPESLFRLKEELLRRKPELLQGETGVRPKPPRKSQPVAN